MTIRLALAYLAWRLHRFMAPADPTDPDAAWYCSACRKDNHGGCISHNERLNGFCGCCSL